MHIAARFAISSAAASVVSPFLFMAFILAISGGELQTDVAGLMLMVAWLISLAHLVALWLPVFFFLQRSGRSRWSTVTATGFLCGAIPVAIFSLPSNRPGLSLSNNWYGRFVETYRDGEPTIYAWLECAEFSFRFGLFGVVAAVTYWRLWLLLSSKANHHAGNA